MAADNQPQGIRASLIAVGSDDSANQALPEHVELAQAEMKFTIAQHAVRFGCLLVPGSQQRCTASQYTSDYRCQACVGACPDQASVRGMCSVWPRAAGTILSLCWGVYRARIPVASLADGTECKPSLAAPHMCRAPDSPAESCHVAGVALLHNCTRRAFLRMFRSNSGLWRQDLSTSRRKAGVTRYVLRVSKCSQYLPAHLALMFFQP